VERKAEVGPLRFSPPPVQYAPTADQGMRGCVVCNHSFSYAQRTMPLSVCCRVDLGSAREFLSGLPPLVVASVETRPLGAVSPVNWLGMVGGGRVATNSYVCARTTTPPPPYRSDSLGRSSMGRGSVSLSPSLLFTGTCLCCAFASTSFSCMHHTTDTTDSTGGRYSEMQWVEAGCSPSPTVSGVVVFNITFASLARSLPSMQEGAGHEFIGIICEGQALEPDCSPQKPPFTHNSLGSHNTPGEPLVRPATHLRVGNGLWFNHPPWFCVCGGGRGTMAI
jgi:hypothetical protein